MTVATDVTVFSFTVSMVLGVVLLRTDLRARRNLFFAVYVLSIAVEALVQLRLSSATSVEDFLRYKHADVFTYLGVAALLQFVLSYVRSPFARSWPLLSLVYAPLLIVIGNVLFIGPGHAVRAEVGFLSAWNGWPGKVYGIGIAYTSLVALASAVLLVRHYRGARDPRTRLQSGILALCTTVAVVAGVTFELLQMTDRFANLPLSVTSAYGLVNPVLVFAVLRYDLLELTPERVAREALAAMSDGVLLTDPEGVVTYANASMEAMLGGASPIGQRLAALPFVGRDLDNVRVSVSDEGVVDHECSIRRPGRDDLFVSVSIGVLRTRAGWVRGHLVAVRDMTERKRADDMRDGAEKMLRHDLRNALTIIAGNATVLSTGRAADADSKELARQIQKQTDLVLRQMEAYLALQRLESGTFRRGAEQADVEGALAEAARSLERLAEARGVRVSIQSERVEGAGPVRIVGEQALLFGMFSNLLRNAVEASPEGATVVVRVILRRDLSIAIHNEGAIPEPVRGRFSDKYVTYGKAGGTGLGAYGARRIVEALGGSLGWSTGDAEGTTITVRLPSAAPPVGDC